ncbi:PrsW family glutamic-type intramembrane protease [Mannheimia varigena]|uniref:PrsW family glutamic-type intramembrane protease n=1 Tax=Mannheimia varigena TaxID=85404 RepID=UPI0015B3C668|nr:PrsW family glutamic-type intramembrane protease [Mannheimia varigena]QLD32614.1 PrsW family intramembrane metalloprotease [Mannheimia varigena]
MKKWFINYKQYMLTLFTAWSFFSGCQILFENFGKPNGLDQKYPLFLLTISLILIYLLPMIFVIRYLVKHFKISKSLINLSWLLGVTASIYFSEIGHTIVGLFWLKVVNPSDVFLSNWGAAVSAPFAEEFGKGLVVLLVLLITKEVDLKSALVSGLIVGLSFQIVEDCVYTFRDMFIEKLDGFVGIIERVVQAGGTHWAFSILFAIGMVSLIFKNTGMSKKQGVFWLSMSILEHFIFNTPFNGGIGSKSANITVFLLCLNFCLALAAFKTVNMIETNKTG